MLNFDWSRYDQVLVLCKTCRKIGVLGALLHTDWDDLVEAKLRINLNSVTVDPLSLDNHLRADIVDLDHLNELVSLQVK